MCGIFGLVGTRVGERDSASVRRGLSALAHRGPDATGVRILASPDANCVLGAVRLRIIDLSEEADQPLSNEDHSVWVAFNGEIYNFGELRVDLERAGHRFRSRTDSEILVHLYESTGGDPVALLNQLRGMFAFALFDRLRGRLLIARDRLGIKPLYVAGPGNSMLAFGSELRALAACGVVDARPEETAIREYLSWGVVPGWTTICSGINELPAGHLLLWERGQSRVERWWSPVPKSEPDFADPVDASRVLAAALDDSVARHMSADRPVGTFLSGGLDSGAVAAFASRAPGSLQALTVTFPDVPGTEEGASAERVANALGAAHREVPFTGNDAAQLLPQMLRAMDQPTMNAVNTWICCRAARDEGLVVCLSGLGGDELFGGYPSFELVRRLARARAGLALIPRGFRRQMALQAARRAPGSKFARAVYGRRGFESAYAAVRGLFSAAEIETLLRGRGDANGDDGVRPQMLGGMWAKSAVGFLEMTHYLPFQLLRDTDSVSMAHSIEVRVPLLDDVVVGLALAFPEDVRFAREKRLLARAARLRESPAKRPFALPLGRWMKGPLRPAVREGLLSDELPFAGVLDRGWRKRVWDAFERGQTHWSRPWAMTVLRHWPTANGLPW